MARPAAPAATEERLLVVAALRRAMAASRSPASLADTAAERLRHVVAAARSVEPYRTRWEGAPVDRIAGPGDLRLLPILRRADFADLPIEARLTVPREVVRIHDSSGTSGVHLQSARTAADSAEQEALRGRAYRFQGLPTDVPYLGLELGPNRTAPFRRFGRDGRIGAGVSADDQVAAFREVRPQIVHGPPSLLAELAPLVGPPALRVVLCGSEQLGPELRRELHDLYRADPLDNYGATEVGAVSWQCARREGYHINSDAVVVEVVGEDDRPVPAGVTGELVITALWNTSAPVIRHRIGDLGALVAGPCPCGIAFPLMAQPEGRTDDRILTADGRRVSPWRVSLGRLPADIPEVRRYRVTQREVTDFLVEVVWHRRAARGFADRVRDLYSEVVGASVRVEVRDLDALPPGPGKPRMIRSLTA